MNIQELTKRYSEKTYLGDSVYVHFDGYHFILETNNGFNDDPRNVIGIEPEVFERLIKHRQECYNDFDRFAEREKNQGE